MSIIISKTSNNKKGLLIIDCCEKSMHDENIDRNRTESKL